MIKKIDKSIPELKELSKGLLEEKKELEDSRDIKKILYLLKNSDLDFIYKNINNKEFIDSFGYSNVVDVSLELSKLNGYVEDLKDKIDVKHFFKKGQLFDFDLLKKEWVKQNLRSRYPNFKWTRFKELFSKPVTELKNYAGETIRYNKYLVKKILISLLQMIFNEMDVYIMNTGSEGLGKSCFCSQLMLLYYYLLDEIGLIKYKYDVKQMFFSNITSYLEAQELQGNKDYFRIMVLDEAYDLNRQNFREETTKIFKDDMRRSRKLQRINILNLPQLGEMDVSITLARCNFIFDLSANNKIKTGMLDKGFIDYYVVPRGKYIYSPLQKRNVTGREIKQTLSKLLANKNDYYIKLPKSIRVNSFRFSNVWGFDKSVYDNHIKDENKKKRLDGNATISDYVSYILFKKMPDLKFFEFDRKNKEELKMYKSLSKWKKKIDNKFLNNVDLLKKFEILYSSEKSILEVEKKTKLVIEKKDPNIEIEFIKDCVNMIDENLKPIGEHKKGDKLKVSLKLAEYLKKNDLIRSFK